MTVRTVVTRSWITLPKKGLFAAYVALTSRMIVEPREADWTSLGVNRMVELRIRLADNTS